ncbi:hypothetical protein QNN00_20750 [Bacillus velezensis]|nr:hypothetical protein [Bacillus velezensis]
MPRDKNGQLAIVPPAEQTGRCFCLIIQYPPTRYFSWRQHGMRMKLGNRSENTYVKSSAGSENMPHHPIPRCEKVPSVMK